MEVYVPDGFCASLYYFNLQMLSIELNLYLTQNIPHFNAEVVYFTSCLTL